MKIEIELKRKMKRFESDMHNENSKADIYPIIKIELKFSRPFLSIRLKHVKVFYWLLDNKIVSNKEISDAAELDLFQKAWDYFENRIKSITI